MASSRTAKLNANEGEELDGINEQLIHFLSEVTLPYDRPPAPLRVFEPAPTVSAVLPLAPSKPTGWCSDASESAQQCFRDGLHTAFSFLEMRDVLHAGWTCKVWLAAAESAPSKRARFTIEDRKHLATMANSRFRKHIGALEQARNCWLVYDEDFALLCQLPSITFLEFELHTRSMNEIGSEIQVACLLLPVTLLSVRVRAWRLPPSTDKIGVELVMNSIAQLPRLQTFDLQLGGNCGAAPIDALSCLKEMKALRTLTIFMLRWKLTMPRWEPSVPTTFGQLLESRQIEVIRSLQSLTSLHLNNGEIDSPTIAALFSDCGRTHLPLPLPLPALTELDLSNTSLTADHIIALESMPNLTHLRPKRLDTRRDSAATLIAMMSRLKRLRQADLSVEYAAQPHRAVMVRPSNYDQLEQVTLRCMHLEAIEWRLLLSAMVSLRELKLVDVYLRTLEPLTHAPRLAILVLDLKEPYEYWYQPHPEAGTSAETLEDEIEILATLPSLTDLTIRNFGVIRGMEESMAALKLPSKKFPHLRTFTDARRSCAFEWIERIRPH